MKLRTIISGGQTGADRGGLEAARDVGLNRGGWAPADWRAEDGVIPVEYRQGMMESGSSSYPVRTRANVEASSGTLIVSFGALPRDSGSMLTAKIARTVYKPCLHVWVWSDGTFPDAGADRVRHWLDSNQIVTLNVAGPRESREHGIQAATRAALARLISEWWASEVRSKAVAERAARDDSFGWDASE